MARLLLLPWLFLLPFVHPQLHSDPAFLKFADYSDIEDLLLLAEENVRMPSWIGESRDKQSASAAAGPPQFGPRFKPRQYGVSTFELAKRKRRSEGRFPVAGVFKSADPTPVSHTAPLHSGRIFPSPRIFQRFKPREVAPGQLRVEASSVAGEFPEWLALHAGRRGPIRAKSYRELLLHALNRAQVELSRRHRVHWAGPVPPEEQRLPRGRTLVDGESPSTAPKKGSQPLRDRADDKEKAGEGQLCRDCFAHWRALDATKAMSDWEVAERCCPGKRPPRQQRIGQSKAKEKRKKSGKEGGGRRREEAKSSATATAAGSGKGDGKEAKDRKDGNANADGKTSTTLAPTG